MESVAASWGLVFFVWVVWLAIPMFYATARIVIADFSKKADQPESKAAENRYLWLSIFWIGGFLPLFLIKDAGFQPLYGALWLVVYMLVAGPAYWALRNKPLNRPR